MKNSISSSKKSICIPNTISSDVFHPYGKEECRRILGLNTEKKIILYGAMSALEDPNKGWRYLKKALEKLDTNKYMLVVFGSNNSIEVATGIEVKSVGYIFDELHMALLYNAADVIAVPSEQESFSFTTMEALTCGTPVVAFDVGGIGDQVINGENGFLVIPFDISEFAEKIIYTTNHFYSREKLFDLQMMRFSEEVVAKRYMEEYRKVLIRTSKVN